MASPAQLHRHVVGVMTGTSIDGIDAALLRIEGRGLQMQATLLEHVSRPLGELGPRLRAASEQQPLAAGEFAQLAWAFGELHAAVVAEMTVHPTPDLICVHGQTVFHEPPISWQLVNPAPIAARCNAPVVFDLRQADLAAGGQGAPISPLADWILFRDPGRRRAIANLGGFCNVTILPADVANTNTAERAVTSSPPVQCHPLNEIRGFDVCACNQVLDGVARAALGKAFDEHGQAALRGRAMPKAADALLELLNQQRSGGRSLGTGDEAAPWVSAQIKNDLSSNDIAASAVHAVARCISAAIAEHSVDEIIVAGGGARNAALIDALSHVSQRPLRCSDDLGVPVEAREAIAFAVLGALCADGVPITLPQVTGCREPAPQSGLWSFPSSSAIAGFRRAAEK